MTAPTLAATDPQALGAFASNTLLIAGAALDQAPWEGSTLGASFPTRHLYYRKPPADSCGQLVCWLGRGYTGPQGVEQFLTVPRSGGEYGFHTVGFGIEALTCIGVQQNAAPPSVEQMTNDSLFVYAVGWAMFVGLTQAISSGVLVAPCGRALVGPFEPGAGGGGFASISCAVSIQL